MAHAWVHAYYNSFVNKLDKLADYGTNPNIALVSGFMCAETDEQAIRSSLEIFLREKSCLNFMTASPRTRNGRRPSCPAIWYSTNSAPRNIRIGERRFEKMHRVDRPSRIHSKRLQGIQS